MRVFKHLYWFLIAAGLCAAVLASCFGGKRDRVLAQVGDEKLMLSTLLEQLPVNVSAEDSARFVSQEVERWIEENVLFYQGKRHLDNYKALIAQAEEYKRNLIAQTYEIRLLQRKPEKVTEEQCQEFYEQFGHQLLLDEPIIQGFYVKIVKPAEKKSNALADLKAWLKQMLQGNTDHAEELEQFCQLHSVEYEAWLDDWVDLSVLTDRLPEVVADVPSFLKQQVYEMSDENYSYVFIVSDFRLAGESMPYQYAQSQIVDLLQHRQYKEERQLILNSLYEEMKENGTLIIGEKENEK